MKRLLEDRMDFSLWDLEEGFFGFDPGREFSSDFDLCRFIEKWINDNKLSIEESEIVDANRQFQTVRIVFRLQEEFYECLLTKFYSDVEAIFEMEPYPVDLYQEMVTKYQPRSAN